MENDNNKNNVDENLTKENMSSDNIPQENSSGENLQNKKKEKPKKKFNIFSPFKTSYKQIKSDEEKKEKTVRFGLLSILYSCICIGLCYPCIWLGIKGVIFAFTHNLGPLTYLLGIGNIIIASLSCGAMLLPYYFWFQGIYLVIMQFCLNRRFISWLALFIWLATVVGVFLLSVESFLVVTGLGHLFQ